MFTAIILMCTIDGSLCRAVSHPVVVTDLMSCTVLLGEGVKTIEDQEGWTAVSYRCLSWGEPA